MSDPQKTDRVIYIDPKGVPHNALVVAANGLNPGYLTLVYIDPKADERENVKQAFDVPHMDDNSRQEVRTVQDPTQPWNPKALLQEGNPDLPTIHLNCWKMQWEAHEAPASDHPMFDHPFAPRPTDEDGRPMEKARPEYDEQVAAHQASQAANQAALPSAADLDATAADQTTADATKGEGLLGKVAHGVEKGAEAVADAAKKVADGVGEGLGEALDKR